MFQIGVPELLILSCVGIFLLAGIVTLFFVVRALVRSDDRNSTDTKLIQSYNYFVFRSCPVNKIA